MKLRIVRTGVPLLLIAGYCIGCHGNRANGSNEVQSARSYSPESKIAELERLLAQQPKNIRASAMSGGLCLEVSCPGVPGAPVWCEFRRGGGTSSLRVGPEGYVIQRVPAGKAELRIVSYGFHEWRREIEVAPGRIVFLGDVTLEKVTPDSGGKITGTVTLEGNSDPSIARVSVEGTRSQIENDGTFTLDPVRTGEIVVAASAEGFSSQSQRVEVQRGELASTQFTLYRKRGAIVRWAYQPEELNRSLVVGVHRGISLLMDDALDRISFGEILSQSTSPDFSISQKLDGLKLQFSHRSNLGPGLIQLEGVDFDQIKEVPNTQFRTPRVDLKEGDTFVFKTLDGLHFAKLEIIDIVDGEKKAQATLAEYQTEPCGAIVTTKNDYQAVICAVPRCACIDPVTNAECAQASRAIERAVVESDRFVVIDVPPAGEFERENLEEYWKRRAVQKIIAGRLEKSGDRFALELKMMDLPSNVINAIEVVDLGSSVRSHDHLGSAVCELIRRGLVDMKQVK